jgi:hypothetical protein
MKLKTLSLKINELRGLLEAVEVATTSDVIINAYKSKIAPTRTCAALYACFDGADYWLFDGYHRLAAMKSLGFNTCEVMIYKGTRRDALRRYIKDKLKCIGLSSKHVFLHCLGLLSEDHEWRSTDAQTLSKLFDRKPAFFDNVKLRTLQTGVGSQVRISINKHGTFNLMKV